MESNPPAVPQEWSPESIEVRQDYSILQSPEVYTTLMMANAPSMTDPFEQAKLLSKAINGLNLYHEIRLAPIESYVQNKSCSIRTLPDYTFDKYDAVSTIQPMAWLANDPGGMYDPMTRSLCKNCVGHWQGKANSQQQSMVQELTSPCFMVYHAIVLIAVLFILITHSLRSDLYDDHPSVKPVITLIILGVAILVDLSSVLFIAVAETCYPDEGSPLEASRVQKAVYEELNHNLTSLYECFSDSVRELVVGEADFTPIQASGSFIMRYFYEPSLTTLVGFLKMKVPPFTESTITQLNWELMEQVLILYRFVSQISEAGISDYTQFSEQFKVAAMKRLVISALTKGEMTTHMRLLRMVYLSLLPPAVRSQKVVTNPADLSLRHFLGDSLTEAIISDLKRRPRNSAAKGASPQQAAERKMRIEIVLKFDNNSSNDVWKSNSAYSTRSADIP